MDRRARSDPRVLSVRRARRRLAAILCLTGCSVSPDSATTAADSLALRPTARASEPVAPDANPAAVRDWLENELYRERWLVISDTLPLRPSAEPQHGALVTSYANPLAAAGMERGLPELPTGSILILEDFTPDTTLASVSVMLQTGDRDTEDEGWYFVRLGSAGEISPGGETCAACHVLEPDRVFGAELGTPWPVDSTGAVPPFD